MQQLPRNSQRCIQNPINTRNTIYDITKHRISFCCQMYSNLMHSSRMNFGFYQRNFSQQRMYKKRLQSTFRLGSQSLTIINLDIRSVKFFIIRFGQRFIDHHMFRKFSCNKSQIIFINSSFPDNIIDIL